MKLTGAEILLEVLEEQGVDTVFGYPGGAALGIYDALYARGDGKIHHYLTAHEQGAAHAADGYARACGKPGVVVVTSGPGATNTVTGIANAFMDSIPMVVITANVSTQLIGRDSFQEVYITGITTPITKHNYAVQDLNELAETIRNAFRIAQSGRRGPVLVDIPKDILASACEFMPAPPMEVSSIRAPRPDQVQFIAELLNASERPILCYGGGVVAADAQQALTTLVEKSGIPCCNTLMATGLFEQDNPHNMGLLGMHGSVAANKAVDAADMVLVLGCRMSDRVALNMEAFAKRAKIVQVDIDPSEMRKNVSITTGVVGDVKATLEALLPLVEYGERPEWTSRLAAWKNFACGGSDDPNMLSPRGILQTISSMTDENTMMTTDVGQHQMWAAQHCGKLRRFITSGGLGAMGFGYGAAIGAKLACPDSTVIHITGDGSLHMNMTEACTAVSYGIKVITINIDNKVLGMVRQLQTVYCDSRYMETEPYRKTDFTMVGHGFGLAAYTVKTLAEFKDAFAAALKDSGPVWITCEINPEERVLPMIPSGMTVRDMITR